MECIAATAWPGRVVMPQPEAELGEDRRHLYLDHDLGQAEGLHAHEGAGGRVVLGKVLVANRDEHRPVPFRFVVDNEGRHLDHVGEGRADAGEAGF